MKIYKKEKKKEGRRLGAENLERGENQIKIKNYSLKSFGKAQF